MKIEINDKLYSIDREKYAEDYRSFIITVDINNINYFKEWIEITKDRYTKVNLQLYRDTGIDYSPFAELTNCYVCEITYKPWEGDAFKVEIVYSEYIEHKKPEKINIELHSIQVPENKSLIRTEMEKGVLFTFEDKTPNIKNITINTNNWNNEYWKRERVKCREDIIYFIEKYLTIFDTKTWNKIPFLLTENQKLILRNWDEYNINVIETYRRSGVSCLYAAKATHGLMFEDNVKVAYCGCRSELNNEFMCLIRDFITETKNKLPFYDLNYIKNNREEIYLNNGNQIKTIRLERSCLLPQYLVREATDLIVDDAAFNGLNIGILEELYSKNKCIRTIISSINYSETDNFTQIIKSKDKTFLKLNILKIYWHEDERFNQNLKWYPVKYVEEVYGEKTIKTAYIPGNEWYTKMCEIFGYSNGAEIEIGVGFNPHKTQINNENLKINIKWV
jgi:hypothetical protein